MKKLLLITIASIASLSVITAQQTFTITTSGFQFVPATLTITAGDTVEFSQSSAHPAREVSQATWNANQSTSNGGFDNAHSGTKIKFNTPGTYYYVCSVHFANAMKGQIIVQSGSGVEENKANVQLSAYPSPVISNLNIALELAKTANLRVEIYNVIGELMFSKAEMNYPAGRNLITVDFEDYASGAYIIKVMGKDEQYTLKVVK